ncbi:hypothetical protein [Campylobacter sp.]|uniref:hypothetical protein n=2 Tax=Campylobacter sp. TaxID=205 RepID=UPI002AA8CFE8|nr:hypothetical protein [Campylobacter sp.]MCI6662365.1 hypothetical protein [Campylobacter sp.]MCI7103244.1 hypothetical protein [Campylobacter sp.]MCI7549778.1 hypothetical protein [Campylobacter sp.]
MHKNITLNGAIDKAFLAKQSFESFSNSSEKTITNLDTNSSFETINQIESANGFSATVFRNIPKGLEDDIVRLV